MSSVRPPYDYSRSEWVRARVVDACRIIAIGGLLAILANPCQGCGASALQQHATAAKVTRASLDVAATGIETACDPDAVELRDDRQARAQACVRAYESHDTARAAWLTYVSALVLAAEDDGLDLFSVIPLARSLVAAYREVAEAVGSFGGELPPLPGLLEGF